MMAANLRAELMAKIDHLSDEEVKTILHYIRVLHPEKTNAPADENSETRRSLYDGIDDPTVGMVSGPTDGSTTYKDVLREEIDPHSGFTTKPRIP